MYMSIINHIKIIKLCIAQLAIKSNQKISRALKCQQHYSLNMCVVSTVINTGEVTMRLMANRRAFL